MLPRDFEGDELEVVERDHHLAHVETRHADAIRELREPFDLCFANAPRTRARNGLALEGDPAELLLILGRGHQGSDRGPASYRGAVTVVNTRLVSGGGA